MRPDRACVVLTLLLAAAAAQDKPTTGGTTARAFVPKEMTGQGRIDLRALRDGELFDQIMRSTIAGTLFGMMSETLGFGPEDLDEVLFHPMREGDPVVVLAGNERVLLPDGMPGLERIEVAERRALREKKPWAVDRETLWVSPRDGLLVCGPRTAVEPLAVGSERPGVPPADLLALASGRGVLMHLAMRADDRHLQEMLREVVPEGTELPTHFAVRLVRRDEEGEPVFHLEGVLQWGAAGPMQAATAGTVRQRLAELEKHPRLAAFRRYWRRIEVAHSASDVTATLRLGNARETGGFLGLLLPAAMFFTAATEEVPVIEAIEAPAAPAEPAPAEPAKPRGK